MCKRNDRFFFGNPRGFFSARRGMEVTFEKQIRMLPRSKLPAAHAPLLSRID